uniref:Negative elongation factor complex member E n=1 Tax=Panthera tigris altaica TaxID=74533 RepID=A0A8C9J249_PANTA
MLVIPPGLSEEEEALQKKFNKLKKKTVNFLRGGTMSH